MPTAWLNGKLVDEDRASLSLRDTGLLHGAGVFTTMRAGAGRVFHLQEHLARLRRSCEALFIPLQYTDADLTSAVAELLEQNRLVDARLRLTVTRGQAQQDAVHGMILSPNCFITATELQPYPSEYYSGGMRVVIEDEQKLNPYDMAAGHKTLNYFSRLAAMRQAARRQAGECLWFNVHNYLQSGSVSNVFIVHEHKLITPPTQDELRTPAVAEQCPYPRSNVLPGIMRGAVLELAKEGGIPTQLAPITVDLLLAAEEVFLTNSIMQIMPVGAVEQHALSPVPGKVTAELLRLFKEEYG